MKNIILFALFLIPLGTLSQVGIDTTNPKAILDIESSTMGVLVPRIALERTTQQAPVVNPDGGNLENSTLIYNTVIDNDVRPGFYYWDVNRWRRLGSDRQFLEFTTIDLPNEINNDVDFLLSSTNATTDVFRLTHDDGTIFGGIDGGVHGRILYMYNGGSVDIQFQSEDNSNSQDENKFALEGDLILRSGNAIFLIYDGLLLNRWIVGRSDN